MITYDGGLSHNIWEHSSSVKELYRRRCRKEEVEMTAHAQAAEILSNISSPGDSVLDVGCGAGYFYHAINDRGLGLNYIGIDPSPSLIKIGNEELAIYGLEIGSLNVAKIEDLNGSVDHVVCINVLSNIDNFHSALDRMLKIARKSLIMRESFKVGSEYRWVKDKYLDPGVDLNVYVNHYDTDEVLSFISQRGFQANMLTDRRTNGVPEFVIDYPHYWSFIVARRISEMGEA